MNKLLNVSTAPHIKNPVTTAPIMYDVAIAMIPAAAYGMYRFGMKACLILFISVVTCMLSEYVYQSLMGKRITVFDGSALVTGMILGLNMPPGVPLWIPVLGGIFAIIVVKQLYGGLGQNIVNPALAARCFLLISFSGFMTGFVYDGVSGATPLAMAKTGIYPDIWALITGRISGTIGEISVIALLLGAVYLLVKKIISLVIPMAYLSSFLLFMFIFGQQDFSYLIIHLFGGGLLFGAFFMATDYTTSPITPKGKIVFGVILGILTGLFRIYGSAPEGVSYAVLLGNLMVPLIEKVTLPTAFGKGGR